MTAPFLSSLAWALALPVMALPLQRRLEKRFRSRNLVAAVSVMVAAIVVVVPVVQGALGGLMFWALGLPAPLLWRVVMALLAIVPVLGAFLIWMPAAAFLFLSGHPGQSLLLTLWGTVVVGGIDNRLYQCGSATACTCTPCWCSSR